MRGNRLYAALRDINDGREIMGGERFYMLDYSKYEDWAIIRVKGYVYKVRLKELERATI